MAQALNPYLSIVVGTAPVDGVTSVTVVQERIHGLLVGAAVISALVIAFLVGGMVAGRLAYSHTRLNGAVAGIIVMVVPFVWLSSNIVSVALEQPRNLGEVATRSEGLSMMLAVLLAFCIVSPVLVMSGILGGRIGKR